MCPYIPTLAQSLVHGEPSIPFVELNLLGGPRKMSRKMAQFLVKRCKHL